MTMLYGPGACAGDDTGTELLAALQLLVDNLLARASLHITVSETAPTSPSVNDIWVDTSA